MSRHRISFRWAASCRSRAATSFWNGRGTTTPTCRYDINPVPLLHSLEDHGAVIHLCTISKTLSPMLRIGYLVVPPELQEVFATAKQFADRHSPVAEQEALAPLIESGGYESHVRRVRRMNGERREMLLGALRRSFADRIAVQGADAGLNVVVWSAIAGNDPGRSRTRRGPGATPDLAPLRAAAGRRPHRWRGACHGLCRLEHSTDREGALSPARGCQAGARRVAGERA
jgi:hypothetical protein